MEPSCASVIRKIHPREYFRRFVKESNCRPDCRSLDSFREVIVSCGGITSADASSYVRIGNTFVLAVVKAEVAIPSISAPDLGFLVINIELPPLCSSSFKPSSCLSESLSQMIQNIHQKSPLINMEKLCISKGEAAWCLMVDIYCLSYDGAVLDASLLALASVLKNLRLPRPIYDADMGSVSVLKTDLMDPIEVLSIPLSCSFVCFEGLLLADPTAEEEQLHPQSLNVVVQGKNVDNLLGISMSGSGPLDTDSLQKCVKLSQQRVLELMASIYE